ncbi:hypothetical protein SAMN04489711_10214 [Paracidovorax wautersii]|uniref:Uncharacterized protein n=2 Tax=Paracidovorax wautersii TaxID=1177982 RepID=A0A1I2AHB2_9BURK|nr:hypothetical protein SAMN04489711_10214 [Paracidovorax wautersii]
MRSLFVLLSPHAMNMSLQHALPFLLLRPLLGTCAIVLGLLLGGCGGGGSGSGSLPAQAGTCGSPDTHCAPKP